MIHLHGFSHYSMQQALAKPKEILEKAKQLSQDAIAITDLNSGYGLLEFYEKAQNIGVKPILGAHMLFSYDGKNFMSLVLLAKNFQGYKNLIKLISLANTKNFKTTPYLTIEDLKEYGKNLIGITGGDGEIEKLILANENDKLILEKINEYENIFDGDFYLEFLTLSYEDFPERKKIENKFKEFIKLGKKAIVSSFYKYINKEDKSTYDVLLCIKNNYQYYSPTRPKVKGDYYIMSEEQVKEVLTKNNISANLQEELINQTHTIADKINIEIPLHQVLFPKYIVPEKYKRLYERLKEEDK